MNNYCTNCGNKLKKGDLLCNKCKTSVIDLTNEKEKQRKKFKPINNKIFKRIILVFLGIIILFLIVYTISYAYKKINYPSFVKKELEQKYNAKINSFDFIKNYPCNSCSYEGGYFPYGCDGVGAPSYVCRKDSVKCDTKKYKITFSNNESYYVYIYNGLKILEYRENIVNQKKLLENLKTLNKYIYLDDYEVTFNSDEMYESTEYVVDRDTYKYNSTEMTKENRNTIIVKTNDDFFSLFSREYLNSLKFFIDNMTNKIVIVLYYNDDIKIELNNYGISKQLNISTISKRYNIASMNSKVEMGNYSMDWYDEINEYKITGEINYDKRFFSKTTNKVFVDNYPFESDYLNFNSELDDVSFVLNEKNLIINQYTGLLYKNNDILTSGYIKSEKNLNGNLTLNTRYYDINKNEIGQCTNKIKLDGYRNSNTSFSCSIPEKDLINNNKIEDIVYYKISISSLNVEYE